MKDMGKVMAALKERHVGKMDFGKASGLVKGLLTGGMLFVAGVTLAYAWHRSEC